MAQWVKLCGAGEVPAPGQVAEYATQGVEICVANDGGKISAVDNWCPHRHGPLGEGWLEDGKVVCPWHAWGFDLSTGECLQERSRVKVFALKQEADDLWIDIG